MSNVASNGMTDFTTALASAITVDGVFGAIAPLVPFIGIVTLIAIVWGVFMYFRKKATKRK